LLAPRSTTSKKSQPSSKTRRPANPLFQLHNTVMIGVALDVLGPRRTVTTAFLFAVLGAVVSAAAPNLPVLIAGQPLIGAGCAPGFRQSYSAETRVVMQEQSRLHDGSCIQVRCQTNAGLQTQRWTQERRGCTVELR
jgi:hypothetical protein